MKALQIIVILLTSFVICNQINTIKMDSFDLDAILLEDKMRQPGTPERYAYTFDVDINLFDLADIEIFSGPIKIDTMANGKMEKVMEMEQKYGMMAGNILEHLKMTNYTEKELSIILMAKDMRANL